MKCDQCNRDVPLEGIIMGEDGCLCRPCYYGVPLICDVCIYREDCTEYGEFCGKWEPDDSLFESKAG